jgi:hypothetical protein
VDLPRNTTTILLLAVFAFVREHLVPPQPSPAVAQQLRQTPWRGARQFVEQAAQLLPLFEER